MGCGKSGVGRRLSELLCCPFVDLDAVIEQRSGRSIPEIFESDGEAAFRQMEHEALSDILEEAGKLSAPLAPSHSKAAGPSPYPGVGKCQFRTTTSQPLSNPQNVLILALGGGTVVTPECAEIVREKTECIYLRASVETLLAHLSEEAAGRPMLSGCHVERPQGDETSTHHLRTRIETLMSQRSHIYESTAHHIIDTDGLSIDTIAQTIIEILDR